MKEPFDLLLGFNNFSAFFSCCCETKNGSKSTLNEFISCPQQSQFEKVDIEHDSELCAQFVFPLLDALSNSISPFTGGVEAACTTNRAVVSRRVVPF